MMIVDVFNKMDMMMFMVVLPLGCGCFQQDGHDCFDETADEVQKSHDGMRQCVISVEEFICSKANMGYEEKAEKRSNTLVESPE